MSVKLYMNVTWLAVGKPIWMCWIFWTGRRLTMLLTTGVEWPTLMCKKLVQRKQISLSALKNFLTTMDIRLMGKVCCRYDVSLRMFSNKFSHLSGVIILSDSRHTLKGLAAVIFSRIWSVYDSLSRVFIYVSAHGNLSTLRNSILFNYYYQTYVHSHPFEPRCNIRRWRFTNQY